MEEKREVFSMLLQTKFGRLPERVNALIQEMGPDDLNQLLKQVITAKSLDELFSNADTLNFRAQKNRKNS